MAVRDLDIETLHRLLVCDPETGLLFWRERSAKEFRDASYAERWNKKYAGRAAFQTVAHNGYLQGVILRKNILAHRVVWAMACGVWPETIDHINGERRDNRLCNLRSVSQRENLRNQRRRGDNSSGFIGVGWHSQNRRWRAAITIDGKSIHLGCFDSVEKAIEARAAADIKYGFHPNHGREART